MKAYLLIVACLGLLIAALAFPWDSVYRVEAGRTRTIDDAAKALGSSRHEERKRALHRLVSMGEAARPALREALASADAEVRLRAAAALRELDRAREAPGDRRDREFRRIVRTGLSRTGDLRPGTARFTALLLDSGRAARAACAVADLVERDASRHQRAVILIRDLAHPAGAPYLAKLIGRKYILPSTLHHATEGLKAFGDESVLGDIRLALAEDDPYTRRYALRVLAHLGGSGEAAVARALAEDPEPAVREEAARAIGALAGAGADAGLAKLAADPVPSVRAAAVRASIVLGAARARKAGHAALEDADETVRAAGLVVLRERGEAVDASRVIRCLKDPSPLVRGEAVRALGALGGTTAAVSSGVTDASPAVRRAAWLLARNLAPEDRARVFAKAPPESDSYVRELKAFVLGTN